MGTFSRETLRLLETEQAAIRKNHMGAGNTTIAYALYHELSPGLKAQLKQFSPETIGSGVASLEKWITRLGIQITE